VARSAGVVIAADLIAYAADGADERVVSAGIDFAAEVVDVDVDSRYDAGDDGDQQPSKRV